MPGRLGVVVAVVVVAGASGGLARAQPTRAQPARTQPARVQPARVEPTDEARRLFAEARALVERGAYDEACPRFARSQELERAAGTMLNLGECEARAGELARAWTWYDEAAHAYRRAGKGSPAAFARARADALTGRVGFVTVRIAEPDLDGLSIRIGQASVAPAATITLAQEPGEVQVRAKAPGRDPYEVTIHATAGKAISISLPVLAPAGAAAAEEAVELEAPREPVSRALGWKISLGVSVGVTLAAAGGWLYSYALVQGANQTLCAGRYKVSGCMPPPSGPVREAANAQGERGELISQVSSVAMLASGAVAALSLYKLLTSDPSAPSARRSRASAAAASIAPFAAPGTIGISLGGGF